MLLCFLIGDDERGLRAANSKVRILSILKNGVHLTLPSLERCGEQYLSLQQAYQEKQQELVEKALATARTYLPVLEAVHMLVSELDCLTSFATAAALAPGRQTPS
jgi:DNA mismatch repair protein MSH2